MDWNDWTEQKSIRQKIWEYRPRWQPSKENSLILALLALPPLLATVAAKILELCGCSPGAVDVIMCQRGDGWIRYVYSIYGICLYMYVLWNTHMCIQIWINILCVHGLNICHISSCIGRLSQIEDYWYTSICTSCSFVGVLLCSMTMKKDERISSHDDPWLCKIPKETGDVFFGLFFRRLAADLCHSTSPGRPQLQDSTLGWRYGLNVVIFKPCAKITFARTFRKLKWKNVNKWILNKLNATLNHDIFIKSDKDTKIKSGLSIFRFRLINQMLSVTVLSEFILKDRDLGWKNFKRYREVTTAFFWNDWKNHVQKNDSNDHFSRTFRTFVRYLGRPKKMTRSQNLREKTSTKRTTVRRQEIPKTPTELRSWEVRVVQRDIYSRSH